MTNTINNSTAAQANKPTPLPQPAPDQKTNAPVIPPAVKTAPLPPVPPCQPIAKPPKETEIKTTEPAQNTDIASDESKKIPEQPPAKSETASFVAPDEPKEKTKESQTPVTEQIIEQAEKIQEKNKTEPKISENNIQKTDKELPHQENDLVPFEIVEHEQEPPKKLGLKEAISTLPENEKPPKPVITTMPKSTAAKTDFTSRFRNKLKQLLGMANQKRQDKAQANLDKIMEYAREKQKIVNDDVEKLINISDRQALRYLKKLTKQGKLIKFGKKKNTFYKPVNK